jgi:hypothetical protein
MDALIPVLPRLKPGANNVRPPSKPGWSFRDVEELQTIANALDVAIRPGTAGLVVDAIPDMWARILLFAFALIEEEHPLHKTYIAAFRGFLALLAFRNRKNINVDAQLLDMSGTPATTFHAAAQRLRPENYWMSADTRWDELSTFTLGGHVIGITSPLTLVCPGEGLHLTPLAQASWCFDGFRFIDPTPYLDQRERKDLAGWIAILVRSIGAHPQDQFRPGDQYRNHLIGLLDSTDPQHPGFRQDLLAAVPAAERAGEPVLFSTGMTLSHGLYKYLAPALPREPVKIDHSMVRLSSLRPGTKNPTLLVIDDSLDRQWGKKPAEIVIADGVSLRDVPALQLGADHKLLGSHTELPAETEWRFPQDFFTDRLVLIRDAPNAFPGAFPVAGQSGVAAKFGGSPILPLKDELLKYLTVDHICKNAYFKSTGDTIEFGLLLPLEGGGGMTISQVYGPRSRPIEFQEHGVPVLEIWPNFASPEWNKYFLFWDSRGGDVFYARPLGSLDGDSFPEWRGPGQKEREVTEISSAPEFIKCTVPQPQPNGSVQQVPAGVLMPRLQVLGNVPPIDFHIGVDFGTTNTNVYLRKEGEARPVPLELKTVTHPVTAPLQSDREETLYRSFLPPATTSESGAAICERSPFLSFFSTRSQAPQGKMLPIKHGHILFYHVFYNHRTIGTDRVSTNLKWQDGARTKLEAYIHQVCMHAAVEAFRQGGRNIHWYYSLPTAFPRYKVGQFRALWAGVVDWVGETLGTAPPLAAAMPQTESVAAAKYFASLERAFPQVGAAFIDIGGGTSDISIWQSDKLLIQNSVRLSGAQIILEPLFRRRSAILKVIPPDILPEDRRRELEGATEWAVFCAKTDALLRSQGAEILNWLLRAPDDADLKLFIDYIGLGLSGLFYYCGLMFKHLAASGGYVLKEAAGQCLLPSIHVGGNGCNLLHWVADGRYDERAPINEIFRDMLLHAAGWEDRKGKFRIDISPEPKAEAAYGLVVEFKLKDFDSFDESAFETVVSGESFTIQGGAEPDAQPATSLLSRDKLKQGVEPGALESLRDFAGVYNKFAQRPGRNLRPIGDLDSMLSRVYSSVVQWVGQQKSSEVNEIQLEPLFIVGLRAFLTAFLEGGD